MKVSTGLDVLERKEFAILHGKKIGILCHQASVNREIRHILDILLPLHEKGKLMIKAVFGPQHGLWGHTQDNMIEWEGFQDKRTGLTIYSLYGKIRKPTHEMLQDLDLLIIDLQDVGSRYYTFIWTMALAMESCAEVGVPIMVLDRINPISGNMVEGTLLDPNFRSFVGLFPLAQRHGMTIGELANYFKEEYYPTLESQVVLMEGWSRSDLFSDTGFPWVMPSPNIPFWQTALVYPGMCLLEGTNLSEGRGTTRPFEIFGAPWIDGWNLCRKLNQLNLQGVYFRPIQFLPTYQKYKNEICQGAFIHLTNMHQIEPVLMAVAILLEINRLYSNNFSWKNPPYEYEHEKMPFDILAGNGWLRAMIEEDISLTKIEKRMNEETSDFEAIRENYLMY